MINLSSLVPISSFRIDANPALLPEQPGVYLIFFDSGQLLLESSGYLEFDADFPPSIDGYDLLYVGATIGHLRSRVLEHLVGNSQGSTLRMTVGALLSERLSLEAIGSSNRTYYEFGYGERRLTDWLLAYTKVGVHLCEDPFGTERELLKSVPVPLNISERRRHPYSKYLMSLRSYFAGRPKGHLDLKARAGNVTPPIIENSQRHCRRPPA